jgi:hypothetical protein
MAMRSAIMFSMAALLQHVWADCSSPLVDKVLHLFNVSSIADIPEVLLDDIQGICANGHCPKVKLPGCDAQSVDDLSCEALIVEEDIKIGTNAICDIACDGPDLALCKLGCHGVNSAICYTTDFVLCKVGCLGFKGCIHGCEHVFVDPCKKHLVDQCYDGCHNVFSACKNGCENELTLKIKVLFERLEHVISSLAIHNFDLDCQGNGLISPLKFNASASVGIENLGLGLKIHTADLSITTNTKIELDQLKLDLTMPVSGSLQCGLKNDIDISVGDASVDAFDLNLDVNNKAFRTIASIICLDLPFCKHGIEDGINNAIKKVIVDTVPGALAKVIAPSLQAVADVLKCPGGIEEVPKLLV